VLIVRYAIFTSVFLNSLAIALVSLPVYVNVAHYFVLFVVVLCCFVLFLRMYCGYSLFANIVLICCSSFCLLSVEMGYVFSLFIRKLIAEFLCSLG
jgi:hypothetical protein